MWWSFRWQILSLFSWEKIDRNFATGKSTTFFTPTTSKFHHLELLGPLSCNISGGRYRLQHLSGALGRADRNWNARICDHDRGTLPGTPPLSGTLSQTIFRDSQAWRPKKAPVAGRRDRKPMFAWLSECIAWMEWTSEAFARDCKVNAWMDQASLLVAEKTREWRWTSLHPYLQEWKGTN